MYHHSFSRLYSFITLEYNESCLWKSQVWNLNQKVHGRSVSPPIFSREVWQESCCVTLDLFLFWLGLPWTQSFSGRTTRCTQSWFIDFIHFHFHFMEVIYVIIIMYYLCVFHKGFYMPHCSPNSSLFYHLYPGQTNQTLIYYEEKIIIGSSTNK